MAAGRPGSRCQGFDHDLRPLANRAKKKEGFAAGKKVARKCVKEQVV